MLEKINGFTIFGDPDIPTPVYHGGLAVYVKDHLSQYVKNLRYGKCSLSFSLSIFPNVFFMGIYVYPIDSLDFDNIDYGVLINDIRYWLEKGYIPIIGGDFNSIPGDLNKLSINSLRSRFANNIDSTSNKHGESFVNLCVLRILPLDHCIYNEKIFDGKFTYFKANKKSQIDFVLANNLGRKLVKRFDINLTGWHLSDHVPLTLRISVSCNIDLNLLVARSNELLHSYIPTTVKSLKTFKHQFHLENAQTILFQKSDTIMKECQNQTSADLILDSIYGIINPILESTKISKTFKNKNDEDATRNCDECFQKYTDMLNTPGSNNQVIIDLYEQYQKRRNQLHAE